MLLNSNHLYYYRKPKSKIILKNNDSFHLGATPKHFSFTCLNSNFPPFLWPLICSYWVWLTDELVNKQNLVWLSSNHMFLRSVVSSKHLEEGSLPQMFENQSPSTVCLAIENLRPTFVFGMHSEDLTAWNTTLTILVYDCYSIGMHPNKLRPQVFYSQTYCDWGTP